MGTNKSYFRKEKRPLTVAAQAEGLRRAFPKSKVTFNQDVAFTWVGQLQPSSLSCLYTVKITYRLKNRPEVTVVEPELLSRNGDPVPHVFSAKRLCLFKYKYNEWNSTLPIAETILPWTSLWLFHYEIWLATGKWCGSKQEHPGDGEGKNLDG